MSIAQPLLLSFSWLFLRHTLELARDHATIASLEQ
jgi:hypothetical protein